MFCDSFNLILFFVGKKAQNLGMTFLTFIILYNNLIPISLTVTLEVGLKMTNLIDFVG